MKRVLWGVALILCGIAYALTVVGVLPAAAGGWWAFFIIIPCLIWLITDGIRSGALFGLAAGIMLFLWKSGYVAEDILGKLILPVIIVIIGLMVLVKTIHRHRFCVKIDRDYDNDDSAIFSERKSSFDGKKFTGGSYSAVFGSFELDLRNAIIESDATISVNTAFGSAKIFLPNNVNVKMSGDNVFGGAKNQHTDSGLASAPTVFINADSAFGSLTVY
ncbi:MAG TPA: LiaF-related protein [Oscillospiraceae bacterium]|nr:LiaF-related protein [Oscillospiraceae bacterium]HPR75189.1 LiaF-related protein [Oscillospiraceae bacterium]